MIRAVSPIYDSVYMYVYVMYVKCYGVSRAKIDMNEILRLDAYILILRKIH